MPTETNTKTFSVQINIAGRELKAEVGAPDKPVQPSALMPMFRALSEAIVDLSVKGAEDKGEKVACKKGCGACCRQLVPISETEARQIRDLVESLPEPRRTEIRARFAAARVKLESAGILDRLQHPEKYPAQDVKQLGIEYFHLGIPCPFLEEESCSIYPDRPIRCREYLVTSPPEYCAEPTVDKVKQVRIPLKVWASVVRLDETPKDARFIRYVPLILAPAWADARDEPAPRPGTAILELFLNNLLGPKGNEANELE